MRQLLMAVHILAELVAQLVQRAVVQRRLVVDRQGRLQLVNRAAQAMLQVDGAATGRPYLEVIRHPDISAQLTAKLRGEQVDTRELALAREVMNQHVGFGEEIRRAVGAHWPRFAIRSSGARFSDMPAAIVVDSKPSDAIVCPAQTGHTACCATCEIGRAHV